MLRFIPEPGNTGGDGGAYLLLAACPGCSRPGAVRDVPTLSVATLPTSAIHHLPNRWAARGTSPIRYPSSSSMIPDTRETVRSGDFPPPSCRGLAVTVGWRS